MDTLFNLEDFMPNQEIPIDPIHPNPPHEHNPNTPPHSPPPNPPPPPVVDEDQLRENIRANLIVIQGNIDLIKNDPRVPPHLTQFASTMQTIVDSVRSIDADLDRFHQWREERRQFYVDGFSYK